MYHYLSEDEKYAIIYAMNCVIGADGLMQPEENKLRSKMLIYLELYKSKEDEPIIRRKMEEMNVYRAVALLSNLPEQLKKFAVAAMVGTMKADGIKHSQEIHTIDVITSHAKLPHVSEQEAYDILNQCGLIGSKWNLLWKTLF